TIAPANDCDAAAACPRACYTSCSILSCPVRAKNRFGGASRIIPSPPPNNPLARTAGCSLVRNGGARRPFAFRPTPRLTWHLICRNRFIRLADGPALAAGLSESGGRHYQRSAGEDSNKAHDLALHGRTQPCHSAERAT